MNSTHIHTRVPLLKRKSPCTTSLTEQVVYNWNWKRLIADLPAFVRTPFDEHRLTICVKSSMIKESLRCDRSGDLQDPLFFSAFRCRVTWLAWSNGFQRLETRFTCCRSAPRSALWASYFKDDPVITCTPTCWPLSHYPTEVMSHESHRQPVNNHLR